MVDMKDSMLGISWHDSAWIPGLKPANVLDYFSERTNPFYDRTCNNEIVKMQRLSPDQLNNMTGTEYILLHVQEPILYVIRKQHRHSSTQATPLADYYIIAGIVYQAPDLSSVFNARILSCGHHLQSAFDEALAYSRYHPSKGYWWEFKDHETDDEKGKPKEKGKEETSSLFQRQRVDLLLAELTKKYPPKFPTPPQPPPSEKPAPAPTEETTVQVKQEPKVEIKQEKIEGPSPTAPPTTNNSNNNNNSATSNINNNNNSVSNNNNNNNSSANNANTNNTSTPQQPPPPPTGTRISNCKPPPEKRPR